MKSKLILISCVLLAVTSSVMAQRRVSPSSQELKLTIHLHGWAIGPGSEGYLAGKPISIRSVWKNTGKAPISFLLKDHDPYVGTLKFPLFVWARVTDSSGRLLTKSDNPQGVMIDGWWGSALTACDFFIVGSEMPGDIITLKSGQELTRIIPLAEVLRGLKNLPNGLEPGTYTVELFHSDQLNEIDIISNKLEIKVVAED